jgi:peptidoglycan biosynthesis protein MviN/MurJ (putative lipid II flippase)
VATLTSFSAVTLIGILIAPLCQNLANGFFSFLARRLTILLARIMYPFIILVSLAPW